MLWIKLADFLDDVNFLGLREFRIDRDGQHVSGRLFRDGKDSFLVAEVLEAFLEVEREGIIDLRSDGAIFQMRLKIVPVFDPERVLIKDMVIPVAPVPVDRGGGPDHPFPVKPGFMEFLIIIVGVFLPLSGPGVQIS
jgi:hypothetical protein